MVKQKVFSLRLEDDLFLTAKNESKKDGRSLNSYIIKAIEEKIKRDNDEPVS